MSQFEKVKKLEPVTEEQLKSLVKMVGLGAIILDLGNVDLKAGRGVLEGNNRCLWTKAGHRITITVSQDMGVVSTISREIDPDKPGGVISHE